MTTVPWWISDAAPDEVPAIAALEADAFPLDAWSESMLDEIVGRRVPTTVVLAAREHADAALAGYAVVAVVDDVAELQRIAVAPAHRGRGVGDDLLGAVDLVAHGRGARRLLLEVREGNAPALALYARHAFAPIGRRERYYRDGAAALVLERPVTAPGPDAGWSMTW